MVSSSREATRLVILMGCGTKELVILMWHSRPRLWGSAEDTAGGDCATRCILFGYTSPYTNKFVLHPLARLKILNGREGVPAT